ncbi:MAG: NAD(P)H-binding protein [Gammaproteobacteria bacterium]|nr:NAD(P)H-binding protein [Gammaproteobacteria bacterium]
MRVALFGGTGFVGSYLVEQLLKREHMPVLLVRPGSEAKCLAAEQCAMVPGTVASEDAVSKTLDGCDAAIYNIGILREFPARGITFQALQFEGAKRTIELAAGGGVKRFLLMSANGVKADGTPYQQTKYMAEQFLAATDLEWTIFRPSVIFGDPRGKSEFATELRDQLIKSPLPAPLFYDGLVPFDAGRFALSPVHVRDVTTVMANALNVAESVGQHYPLCGPQTLEWREIIRLLGKVMGRSKLTLPAPTLLLRPLASLLERFEFFPVTGDQLTMLMEGNTCDSTEVFKLFDIQPTGFDEKALAYLHS